MKNVIIKTTVGKEIIFLMGSLSGWQWTRDKSKAQKFTEEDTEGPLEFFRTGPHSGLKYETEIIDDTK